MASMASSTSNPRLDHHSGADRVGNVRALNRDSPHHLVAWHEWVHNVSSVTTPDLDVGTRDTCGFDGEPPTLAGTIGGYFGE